MHSLVAENIADYMGFRTQRGYVYVSAKLYILRAFVRHLIEQKVESPLGIDSAFIMRYATALLQSNTPQTVNSHLQTLSDFFLYLQRMDLCEVNPFENRVRFRGLKFAPYTFSDDEIGRILKSFSDDAKRCNYVRSFRSRLGRHCLFTILAHCGLRISEACKLRVKDVSLEDKTLYIEKTKFHKDRMIPISSEVICEIRNYLEVRKFHPKSKETKYLFFTPMGSHVSTGEMEKFFRHKMQYLGIWRKPYIRGDITFGAPTPHAFRHAFALRIVRKWKSLGFPIDQIADTLATYMGHSDFSSTQVYLKALSREPEILIFNRVRRE